MPTQSEKGRHNILVPPAEWDAIAAAAGRMDVPASWFLRKAAAFALRNPAAFGRFLTGTPATAAPQEDDS
ncbi:hypothetical protein [Cellulosimicrobium sp. Marseille-Q4280]|uniref:hypothetical protein n=1 Tax=Cellulosimicrobium sp. Marseille-Q4280 TaxID=2937992 RepID=UPI00203EB47A|nr:hypothetical protein [Cellulosimicrobium sp. Marseille-Q4280]